MSQRISDVRIAKMVMLQKVMKLLRGFDYESLENLILLIRAEVDRRLFKL